MLVYWVHPQRTLLWVLLPERVELVQIPVGRDALREAIAAYLLPIGDRVRAEDLVLRGSNGGGPTDPHWVHNARAHPQAWVRLHRKTKPMHVHVAQGEEREKLYETLCRMSFTTERYQQMCKPRELPLVVLRDWSRVAST